MFMTTINVYNPTRKRKISTVFDDMIAAIMANKKIQGVMNELFINTKYFTCFYFIISISCSEICQIKFHTYLIMELNNKRVLHNIAINHPVDTDYKDFVKIY